MDQETLINKILSQDLLREEFKRVVLELTPREQKILSLALGLENGASSRSLEDVCRKFKITKIQYQRILRKAIKRFEEEKRKPIGAKPGWRYSYLSSSQFSNFEEFKDMVWKLFKKGYKIDKVEFFQYSHLSKTSEEMWICNKKARKCYIFIAITDQDKKFFDVLLSKKKEV
jgi:hypothetical protein